MLQKSNILTIKSIALLIIFVLVKMEILHAASHAFSHDEIAECEDCLFVIDTNKNNLFDCHSSTYEVTTETLQLLHKPIRLLYKNPIITEYHIQEFFNKPPPNYS
jgi:hypothetical protein